VERLPWLLNESLEPAERRAVAAHLEGCTACQKEMEDTRLGAAVYAAHVPSADIVALAWERSTGEVDADLARRHLAFCEECAEGLRLARESRELAAAGEPAEASAPFAPRRRSAWQPRLVAAAGLVVALAGWLLGRAGDRTTELQRVSAQLASAEASLAELRQAEEDLRGRLSRATAPQPNLPVYELLPRSQRRRSAAATETLVVPAGAGFVALVLSSALPGDAVVRAELIGPDGERVPLEGELEPSPLGGYTLGLPAAALPEGRIRIVLYRGDAPSPAETFEVEVRRPQP
jgi:hypothetical protein